MFFQPFIICYNIPSFLMPAIPLAIFYILVQVGTLSTPLHDRCCVYIHQSYHPRTIHSPVFLSILTISLTVLTIPHTILTIYVPFSSFHAPFLQSTYYCHHFTYHYFNPHTILAIIHTILTNHVSPFHASFLQPAYHFHNYYIQLALFSITCTILQSIHHFHHSPHYYYNLLTIFIIPCIILTIHLSFSPIPAPFLTIHLSFSPVPALFLHYTYHFHYSCTILAIHLSFSPSYTPFLPFCWAAVSSMHSCCLALCKACSLSQCMGDQ